MSMETFSALDDPSHSLRHPGISLEEIHKTRLVRIDMPPRTRTDPFQRRLHMYLRAWNLWRLSRDRDRDGSKGDEEGGGGQEGVGAVKEDMRKKKRWTHTNTTLIAEILGRITTSIATAVFLIVPLAILSKQSSKNVQLVVVSVWIIVLAFLVSLFLRVSSFEMMAICAAYAAVLSVFVSNVPAG
jgi:hypothetical protein